MSSAADPPHILDVFAVHSDAGGHDDGAMLGPRTLRQAGLFAWLEGLGFEPAWHDIDAAPGEGPVAKPAIGPVADVCRRLSARVRRSVSGGRPFLTLGGDHSCAIGTWSGAHAGLDGRRALGVLWVDAHMDSHIPETSPSSELHGMPVAHLLGFGAPELTGISGPGPALRPGDVAIIGARSFEPEEPELLDRLGVRVYLMTEVQTRGVPAVVAEALGRITAAGQAFGISIDLDALDPGDAPGTGSAVENGIRAAGLAAALRGIGRARAGFLGLEIAEFNPSLDRGGRTVETVRTLIESVFDEP